MGIFAQLFEGKTDTVQANMETTSTDGKEPTNPTTGYVGQGNTNKGAVTEDDALKIASLLQGINIISDTIASMPIYLFKDEEGFQQMFPLDSRSLALSNMANEVFTSFNLKKTLVKDLILYGNAYAKIRREGEKTFLDYLPPNIITPKSDGNGYFYNVKAHSTSVMGEKKPAEMVNFEDMLVLVRYPQFNSIVGKGLLDYAEDMCRMAQSETEYLISLFDNGLSAKAILTSKTPFKKEIKERLKADLKNLYSGSSNAGKIMVLEGEIGLQSLSLTPTDIKLIENKHFTISEIARFLNIPKHMLALDRQQGTYSNITQERLMLLQNTLMPYVTSLEEALSQKLLTPEEQEQGYYFKFDVAEMLKLTPEDQASYTINLYREGMITLEEARMKLNLGGNEETINELKAYQGVNKMVVQNIETSGNKTSPEKEKVEGETKNQTPKDENKEANK